VKSISYEKFADRFLAYTHRGKYILIMQQSHVADLAINIVPTA